MDETTCVELRKKELREAVKLAGGASAVAEHLGLSRGAIYDFIRRGDFAAEHCPVIEKFSNGRVKCEILNRLVDWPYVRQSTEPATTEPAAV